MNIFLDDSLIGNQLWPFTNTRHVANIRIGMLTILEKWKYLMPNAQIFLEIGEMSADILFVPAHWIPSEKNINQIIEFAQDKSLHKIAPSGINKLEFPWHIFQLSDEESRNDFPLLVKHKKQTTETFNIKAYGQDIFIEEGATLFDCSINATSGPVFIGKNARILEGALIRGPFFLGENAVVKMGAKIYGATCVGEGSIVGGEIKNSVFFNNSNKAHDGYIGDSVIGAWCNLGAGTSNSNVKNTFGNVYFPIPNQSSESAGIKAGLLMGDYSKAAINTSFYTGTVVGTCCHIFGNEIPKTYLPDFSWGNNEQYELNKALSHINQWRINSGANKLNHKEINDLTSAYKKTTT